MEYFLLMCIYGELLFRQIDDSLIHKSIYQPIYYIIDLSTDQASHYFPPILTKLCYWL